MLVLFENPAGFALFKVLNDGKLKQVDNVYKEFESPDAAHKFVSMQAFHKFENTTEALTAVTSLMNSKLSKNLKSFLKKNIVGKQIKEQLAISDSKLGGVIKEKLGIECVADKLSLELVRGIRFQMNNLITGLSEAELNQMALGLSHSLSRYKIKFSTDKVDTMIVQAIGLWDDLNKELNTYSMRVKEWYGWHFPELAKIVVDNKLYAKVIKRIGFRTNPNPVLKDIVPEELETEIKELAKISMGTEISQQDLDNIHELCDQILDMSDYIEELLEYLKNRMSVIAPNLSCLVGELVGARLISHAGSLLNLAKYPASTVQILGAEKALFRALKTKHATPKYGLIYHASLVGQSSGKNKGKISRVLANKCALAIRVDALGDKDTAMIGPTVREQVEARLQQLEGKEIKAAKPVIPTPAYDYKRSADQSTIRESKNYNVKEDIVGVGLDKKEKKEKPKKTIADEADKSDEDDESEMKVDIVVEKKKKKDKSDKKDKKEKSDKKYKS